MTREEQWRPRQKRNWGKIGKWIVGKPDGEVGRQGMRSERCDEESLAVRDARRDFLRCVCTVVSSVRLNMNRSSKTLGERAGNGLGDPVGRAAWRKSDHEPQRPVLRQGLHCAVIPACRTTFAHFSISLRM